MQNFFGVKKAPPKAPPAYLGPSLMETAAGMDERIAGLDEKIKKCDQEIVESMKNRMGRNGDLAKQRAVQALKRKKMFNQQRDQLLATQMNVESVAFQQENLQMTAQTVGALTASTASMKQQIKQLNMDSVAEMMDEQQELAMDMEEINEMMTRNYALDGVDEGALDAEFEQLEAEIRMEEYNSMMSGPPVPSGLPSYLPSLPSAASCPGGALQGSAEEQKLTAEDVQLV